MRIETLLLYVSLALCLITPIACFVIKTEVKKRMMSSILFLIITSLLLVDLLLMFTYQLQSDFRFQYVYSHTSIDLKGIYKISALWSGQEGSFLLWSVIMAIMGIVVTRIKMNEIGKVTALYSVICGVVLILTVKSNPFQMTGMEVSDGLGLNDALQSPWMVVHPPLVFIGYSAMAVLLSFAIAINNNEKCINNLNYIIKKWVRISFVFLGVGIFTGSIWAYTALGWGGYWSWDPIENAALVPLLILGAYLYGKNKLSRMECIIPFILAGFGTFLTRSGILTNKSVHAYAGGEDSVLTFIIFGAFILLVITVVTFNITAKRKENKLINTDALSKHMGWFRMITYVYAAFIFIGTIFPLLTSITITTGYYNYLSVAFVIIMVLLILKYHLKSLLKDFMLICILNTILLILILFVIGVESIWLFLLWLVFLPIWILGARLKIKNLHNTISHIALIFLFVGAIASSTLSENKVVVADITDGYICIANHSISLNQLQNQECLILSSIRQDIILNNSNISSIDEKTELISYTTKPLIILFWIGGFLLIASVAFGLLDFKKTKAKTT